MFRKILCWLGFHKVNEEDWSESFGWSEEYLGDRNWCEVCGKMIIRK